MKWISTRHTLSETNEFTLENRPFPPKWSRLVFQPSIFRGKLAISFSECLGYYTYKSHRKHTIHIWVNQRIHLRQMFPKESNTWIGGLLLGGGNSNIFVIFTPIIWGRWTQFDERIFQMGWLKPPTSSGTLTTWKISWHSSYLHHNSHLPSPTNRSTMFPNKSYKNTTGAWGWRFNLILYLQEKGTYMIHVFFKGLRKYLRNPSSKLRWQSQMLNIWDIYLHENHQKYPGL